MRRYPDGLDDPAITLAAIRLDLHHNASGGQAVYRRRMHSYCDLSALEMVVPWAWAGATPMEKVDTICLVSCVSAKSYYPCAGHKPLSVRLVYQGAGLRGVGRFLLVHSVRQVWPRAS
jgi:hypothetical protein